MDAISGLPYNYCGIKLNYYTIYVGIAGETHCGGAAFAFVWDCRSIVSIVVTMLSFGPPEYFHHLGPNHLVGSVDFPRGVARLLCTGRAAT